MTIFSSTRATLAILAIALLSAVIASLLPDLPYQRWQLLDGTIHRNARWIYERVHFDPTPIDIAFVGPSRLEAAIDAPRLQQDLARRGIKANVVNFSLPENGRDIHYAVVEETLKAKRPKLLVVGVIEKPGRYGHSAFKYIAPAGLVADPGYPANVNWPANLIYLPYRQLELLAARFLPEATGLRRDFDPARYRGTAVDTTGDRILPGGVFRNGTKPAPLAELKRGVEKLERGTTPPILPSSMADVEFGDERHYTRLIVKAAEAAGVQVAFLSLPYYTGPSTVQEQSFYQQYGPVWNAAFTRNRADLFVDYAHLTAHGADIVTDWTAGLIAKKLAPAGDPKKEIR